LGIIIKVKSIGVDIMPRIARVKSFDSVYHIMVRSISDTPLFRKNTDKDKYLKLFKKYQDIFNFKVYSYCLMETHAHFILDPQGADISKIMHGINLCYAQYFNREYKRHGHVFQDRFKSIIINDDGYLLNLSAYIHKNPSDIGRYRNCIHKYPYSSLGIFYGLRNDNLKLLDRGFILQILSKDIINARHIYKEMLEKSSYFEMKTKTEFRDEGSQYRSERVILVRNQKIDNIIDLVSKATGLRRTSINMKHSSKLTEFRALAVFLMRCYCNFKEKDICKIIGNISQPRVSKLCSIGLNAVLENDKYSAMIREMVEGKIFAA
jgi:putative transposase